MLRRLLARLFPPQPPPAPAPLPQLEMVRDTMEHLPERIVPPGYELRTYRPGDETAWCAIMEGNVGKDWTVEKCRARLIEDPRFQPGNLFFATFNGLPVASACAWQKSSVEQTVGEVHMVAALETHRGKGLGHLVNAAVLHRLRELGFQKAHLLTDDWRLAAIKSYVKASFKPLHTHESHPERWNKIFAELGLAAPDPRP